MAETGIVCVFAKPPRPGKVKTRLAAEIGPEAAADLARAFFADTWQTASALPWARPVLATTETGATEWSGIRAEAWPQGEGDLGDRMERVLRRALATAPFALAIGSDSPGLPQALLEKARRRLESADAVIGPSADGGFYLLGLTRCPPGLLASLPWSAGDTCERTAERLRGRGLSVELLPPWFDVDRIGDLTRLRSLLARGEIVAPRTAAALRRAPPRISVVIPVLDEEARIARQLQRLAFLRGLCEVIVVDGGSRDRTVERARASGHARVITAPRGRADQMNAGAAAATGEVLLFLHADVELPADAPRIVAKALEAPEVVAGAFRTWTVPDGDCRRRLGPLLHLADGGVMESRYARQHREGMVRRRELTPLPAARSRKPGWKVQRRGRWNPRRGSRRQRSEARSLPRSPPRSAALARSSSPRSASAGPACS